MASTAWATLARLAILPRLLLPLCVCVSCAHEKKSVVPMEAGAPRYIRLADAGPLPDVRVTCNDVDCPEPNQSSFLDEIACCLPSGACGIKSPFLGDRCTEPRQRGSVDLNCPTLGTPLGATAQGCCGESGRCGFFDRFGDLGCVVVDRTDAGKQCNGQPENSCTAIVPLICDGPEDCGAGSSCCARAGVSLFDASGCFTSCAVAQTVDRSVWRALCHSDADCNDPQDICITVRGLPAVYGACYPRGPVPHPEVAADASTDASGPKDASPPPPVPSSSAEPALDAGVGISCGSLFCQLGETCCIRDKGEPYCLPRGERCTCDTPRPKPRADGGTDAGRDI